jgi:hypothetical protein
VIEIKKRTGITGDEINFADTGQFREGASGGFQLKIELRRASLGRKDELRYFAKLGVRWGWWRWVVLTIKGQAGLNGELESKDGN